MLNKHLLVCITHFFKIKVKNKNCLLKKNHTEANGKNNYRKIMLHEKDNYAKYKTTTLKKICMISF